MKEQLCDRCIHCSHAPNLFQPYWWCTYFGKEVRAIIDKCKQVTSGTPLPQPAKTSSLLALRKV
nr:MAG TPA: hypothetical protein [Caudoviricetes sp.]